MRTIWKFDIDAAMESATIVDGTPVIDLDIPAGSVVMDVQMQAGRPVFWVDLQDGNDPWVQRFAVIGTGRPVPLFADCWEGTWQQAGFVWHLYSVREDLYQSAITKGQP